MYQIKYWAVPTILGHFKCFGKYNNFKNIYIKNLKILLKKHVIYANILYYCNWANIKAYKTCKFKRTNFNYKIGCNIKIQLYSIK